MSFARLQKKIDEKRNPAVVGIDPDLEHLPPELLVKYLNEYEDILEAAALAVFEWSVGLIDALHDIVPAIKPQSAFFEKLGPHGVLALKKICDYAQSKDMYVIIDAKRGDIGSTAAAYSDAYLGITKVKDKSVSAFSCDALTVNAYLGSDGIKPFIETSSQFDKAIFALVKTSNPSAGELQDKIVSETGEHFYTLVGDLMADISGDTLDEFGYSRVGAVVGATYPEESSFLRKRLSNTFFLVPGYGAQGGTAHHAAAAFDENKKGAIVNSSRGIIAAWKKIGGTYTEAARKEAILMQSELRQAIYRE